MFARLFGTCCVERHKEDISFDPRNTLANNDNLSEIFRQIKRVENHHFKQPIKDIEDLLDRLESEIEYDDLDSDNYKGKSYIRERENDKISTYVVQRIFKELGPNQINEDLF